jgi:hypothetical protein
VVMVGALVRLPRIGSAGVMDPEEGDVFRV